MTVTTKVCTKCANSKPESEFHRQGRGLRGDCKECVMDRTRKWRHENRKRINANSREYAAKNIARKAQTSKAWRERNPGYFNEYHKARRKACPIANMAFRVRGRLSGFINRRGYTKETDTSTAIGCSWPELKIHIESKFEKGMTWDNRGDWHIDHIIPLASASTEAGMLKLCHFTNLQPLWAEDNLQKGAKALDSQSIAQRAH